jgi:hypothetical protein
MFENAWTRTFFFATSYRHQSLSGHPRLDQPVLRERGQEQPRLPHSGGGDQGEAAPERRRMGRDQRDGHCRALVQESGHEPRSRHPRQHKHGRGVEDWIQAPAERGTLN